MSWSALRERTLLSTACKLTVRLREIALMRNHATSHTMTPTKELGLALTLMVMSLRGKALCLLVQISTELVSAPSTSNSVSRPRFCRRPWGSFLYEIRTQGEKRMVQKQVQKDPG